MLKLLAERGIEVDHVTVNRWVQRFTPQLIDAARPRRHIVGGRWFVDETYAKVAGKWRYVYRAVDEHSQVIDVFVSRRRDLRSARTFFRRGSDQCEASRQTGPHRWSSGAMCIHPKYPPRPLRTRRRNPTPTPSSCGSIRRTHINHLTSTAECPAPHVCPTIQRRNSRSAISRTNVYYLMDDGQISSVRIGKRRLIPRTALDEFVSGLLEAS